MRLRLGHVRWICYGVFVMFTSCVSMGKISVQVSVPPQRAISEDIQSIALMNRSMTDSFSNLNQDSLENQLIRKRLVMDQVELDSVAADTTLKVMGNALYESGRFDVVIPVQRNIPNKNVSYLSKSPSLTLPEVKQVCDEFKVDALMLLENFHENVNTFYRVGYENSNGAGMTKEYTIYVQIAFHSNWRLYQPGEKLKLATFEVNDTIFWERTGPTLQETYEQLPTIKEALLGGAIENGQNLANYISPGWQQQTRNYFITNNQEADKAISFVNKNDLQEAENIWMKFAKATSSGFRSEIEYNLALTSEMKGDFKMAFQWAQKSLQSKFTTAAEDYVRYLKGRINGL